MRVSTAGVIIHKSKTSKTGRYETNFMVNYWTPWSVDTFLRLCYDTLKLPNFGGCKTVRSTAPGLKTTTNREFIVAYPLKQITGIVSDGISPILQLYGRGVRKDCWLDWRDLVFKLNRNGI